MPETLPAVVLGSGLSALGALRLLHRAGIPVYSLTAAPSVESRSRWFRPLPGVRETLADGAPLSRLLEGSSLERAVLLACSDSLQSAVSELPAGLAARFPSSTSAPEIVSQLTSKAKFAVLLKSINVPHPQTVIIDDAGSLEHLAELQPGEMFLKPIDSASFIRDYGAKAWWVRDLADARLHLARVRADGHGAILQEYVPGPASNHFLIDGFASAGGQVRAMFARRRLRMYPPEFSNSAYMVSVPLSEVEPAMQTLRAILSALGFRGIFSAEFKRDARDGIFKILEINARIWFYVEFAGRCGVDVCTLAYRDALGLPLEDVSSYRCGVRLVSPYDDLFWARHAWLKGQLHMGAWLRSWLGAQQPLFNWSDPVPSLTDWCSMTYRALRRFVRRRLRPSPDQSEWQARATSVDTGQRDR
jgi:predicted ATP-grasp superfamily ATP-dependent carboligase